MSFDLNFTPYMYFCVGYVMLRMEPRAFSVLGKCSTTEYPNTQNRFLMAGKTLAWENPFSRLRSEAGTWYGTYHDFSSQKKKETRNYREAPISPWGSRWTRGAWTHQAPWPRFSLSSSPSMSLVQAQWTCTWWGEELPQRTDQGGSSLHPLSGGSLLWPLPLIPYFQPPQPSFSGISLCSPHWPTGVHSSSSSYWDLP